MKKIAEEIMKKMNHSLCLTFLTFFSTIILALMCFSRVTLYHSIVYTIGRAKLTLCPMTDLE